MTTGGPAAAGLAAFATALPLGLQPGRPLDRANVVVAGGRAGFPDVHHGVGRVILGARALGIRGGTAAPLAPARAARRAAGLIVAVGAVVILVHVCEVAGRLSVRAGGVGVVSAVPGPGPAPAAPAPAAPSRLGTVVRAVFCLIVRGPVRLGAAGRSIRSAGGLAGLRGGVGLVAGGRAGPAARTAAAAGRPGGGAVVGRLPAPAGGPAGGPAPRSAAPATAVVLGVRFRAVGRGGLGRGALSRRGRRRGRCRGLEQDLGGLEGNHRHDHRGRAGVSGRRGGGGGRRGGGGRGGSGRRGGSSGRGRRGALRRHRIRRAGRAACDATPASPGAYRAVV